jgi:hypothetical protein
VEAIAFDWVSWCNSEGPTASTGTSRPRNTSVPTSLKISARQPVTGGTFEFTHTAAGHSTVKVEGSTLAVHFLTIVTHRTFGWIPNLANADRTVERIWSSVPVREMTSESLLSRRSSVMSLSES